MQPSGLISMQASSAAATREEVGSEISGSGDLTGGKRIEWFIGCYKGRV
jgi:hypothetical protein